MSYILVIGSAHIDALAVTDELLSDSRPDVEGRVSFSLGGTAFNIAKNLTQNGYKAQLLTSLKELSITSDLVFKHCDKFGIGLDWPIFQTESEGGFAGHFAQSTVYKAVCESAIERVTSLQFKKALDDAITQASVVVADTNLQSSQLYEVFSLSQDKRVPVIVAGVSVSRVKRIIDAVCKIEDRPGHLIDVLCVNFDEASSLGLLTCTKDKLIQTSNRSISYDVLANLSVRRLVLSCGSDGYYIYDISKPNQVIVEHRFVNINPSEIKSENGAGDAMVAAIASEYRENYGVWENNIQKFVAPVLKVVSATTEDELDITDNIKHDKYWRGWISLLIALISLITLPIVGKLQGIGGMIEGKDIAFMLLVVLGLSAGSAGGKVRDFAVKLGFIESKQFVSIGTAILPALSGLLLLIVFTALPEFVNNPEKSKFTVPSHLIASIWFSVALLGGWFTDLVVSQRMQLKELYKIANLDERN